MWSPLSSHGEEEHFHHDLPPQCTHGEGGFCPEECEQLAHKCTANLQEPFLQPELHYFFSENEMENSTMAKNEEEQWQRQWQRWQQQQGDFQIANNPPASSHDASSSSTQTSSPRHYKPKPRYYPNALGFKDKEALAKGTENHNLQPWRVQDPVAFHESRKALIPRHGMGNTTALAEIEQDKKQSEQMLFKPKSRIRQLGRLPWAKAATGKPKDSVELVELQPKVSSPSLDDIKLTSLQTKGPEPLRGIDDASLATFTPKPLLLSSRPVHGLRSSFEADSIYTPYHPSFARQFPLAERRAHTRASDSSDKFARRPRLASSHPSSSRTSHASTRVGSPLVREYSPFRADPNATFDDFLVPHPSGKGETHRDLVHLIKPSGTDALAASLTSPLQCLGQIPSLLNQALQFVTSKAPVSR